MCEFDLTAEIAEDAENSEKRKVERKIKTLSLLRVLCVLCVLCGLSITETRADQPDASLAKIEDDVDKSTDKALAYLAKQQQDDGSFGNQRGQSAVTSLCVMAFLAKGHTPGAGPYGEVINKAIDNVLETRSPNGMISGRGGGLMYSHNISTLMLSEVSGMVDSARQEKIDRVLADALKVILSAQQVRKSDKLQGGWRYQVNSRDSDISCSGWALMALRSARNAGCSVPAESIDEAMKFILNCRTPDGGFAYTPGSVSGLARTGTGLLSMELCGKGNDAAAQAAGDWILKHMPSPRGEAHFYYGLYYCSQAMFQLGGDHWDKWARHMYKIMLQTQVQTGPAEGAWPIPTGAEASVGQCYSTAMSVLALSVYCRQLPIYQR